MYEEYFGLERPPFKITPDTSLFYEGGKRGDILAALVYAIHRGEGIIKVVGEVGSGKTMLCRMLQLQLPATIEIVYIANPSVSAEDILFVIAHELELPIERDASKHEVMRMLQDYLLQRHMENKQVVLFVEEAQGMPLDTLEEIRLLSNLETAEHKLLQIILFGQPELDQNLAQQSIRQLRERITHNFELEPLTQEEIHTYLNFRMRQVGYTGPELINNNVAKKIEAHSQGLLRRINIIADKILLSAFAEGTHNLSAKHVSAAVNDSAFNQGAPPKSALLWWILLLGAIALVLALYQTRSHWMALADMDWLPGSRAAMQIDSTAAVLSNDTSKLETAQPLADPASTTANAGQAPVDAGAAEVTPFVDRGLSAAELIVESAPGEAMNAPDNSALQGEPAAAQMAAVEVEEQPLPQPAADEPDAQPVITATEPLEATIRPTESTEVAAQAPADNALQVASLSAADNAGNAAADLGLGYQQWLEDKLQTSRAWLSSLDRYQFSIQVMMRNKSAARELVYYLRNEWPLDLSQTYLYEVNIEGRSIYRVFYSEYESLTQARATIDLLPESVKVNSPYVHSVSRMRRALL